MAFAFREWPDHYLVEQRAQCPVVVRDRDIRLVDMVAHRFQNRKRIPWWIVGLGPGGGTSLGRGRP